MILSTLFFVMLVIVNATCGIPTAVIDILPNFADKALDKMSLILNPPIQALINLGLKTRCGDHSSACYMDDMSKLSLWRFDKNKTQVYKMNESKLLLQDESFRLNPVMNIWIPGFTEDVDDKASEEVIDAYVSNGLPLFFYRTYDYTYSNIFVVKSYKRSVNYAPCNGMMLAKFLCELFRAGIDIANVHIVGHSLGGQTLGYVGRHFLKLCGKKLPRLTALDPAGPCFYNDDGQISSNDADFVDIINCNRKSFGTEHLSGTANFIPNGEGYFQPQCSEKFIGSICSHFLCVSLWIDSVRGHLFEATKCSDWSSYRSGKCNGNDLQAVGYPCSSESEGTYYFHTNNPVRETYSLSDKFTKTTSAPILGQPSKVNKFVKNPFQIPIR